MTTTQAQHGGTRQAVPNSTGIEPPRLKAPAGSADCHIHIYDPRFAPPVARPANATATDYRLLQKRIGLRRVVIVTPRCYVTDNSCTVDAIGQLGIDHARGVAVLRPTVSDAELRALDAGGIRGIRFTLANPETAAVSVDMIAPLASRIASLGWHVQLNMEPDQIAGNAQMLQHLPATIVFDHMGKLTFHGGMQHPAYRVIRGLFDSGRAWVKLSGAYLDTSKGPPGYAEGTALARSYVKAAPERLVWGSDWPHPSAKQPPDDAALFDLLGEWAPDEATRTRILVTNPQTLYGFPSPE
jgi:predicted TIM-barrel fold metal-dependent hydrolase